MIDQTPLAVVILAAGKGTRMKSRYPKVMHPVAGRAMISWIIETAEKLNPQHIIVVTAPGMDDVAAAVQLHTVVHQAQQLGTAHAVACAKDALKDFQGKVLVLLGDGPLYTDRTLRHFIKNIQHCGVPMGFLGMLPADPTGYGRIMIIDGCVEAIVEEKDATDLQKQVRTCWTGVMAADAQKLFPWIEKIDNNNANGEYYLTKLPEIAVEDGAQTITCMAPLDETLGVNSRADLAAIEHKMQQRLRTAAMEGGVTLIDPQTTYFSFDTKLGQDVIIEPNVFFGPGVRVADNVIIHAFSHLEGVTVDSNVSVGPYARLRAGSHLEAGATVGNFIEVNRSTLKAGAKAKHVSYLGDATIGENSNIGAGTVIANYDGFNKLPTQIGQGVFIGSNATIVAPSTIADGAIVGAGSVVTRPVPKDALYLERNAPDIREGAAAEYRQTKGKK